MESRTADPMAAVCIVTESITLSDLFCLSTACIPSNMPIVDTTAERRVPRTIITVKPNQTTRRGLFAATAAPFVLRSAAKDNEIAIADVTLGYEDFKYRTPLKFGGTVVDRVTLLNVHCVVKTRAGKTMRGFGSMPLGNVWSFPSKTMPYERTLAAMKALAERLAVLTRGYPEYGHPIDLNVALEPQYLSAAAEISTRLQLDQPVPKLCTLVVASPFDAAVHDAFGKLHGRSTYQTYGPDLMPRDLAAYLGPEFKGESLERYVEQAAQAVDASLPPRRRCRSGRRFRRPAADRRRPSRNASRVDRLQRPDAISRSSSMATTWPGIPGVSCTCHRAAAEAQAKRNVSKWVYSLDFNEKCPERRLRPGLHRQGEGTEPRGIFPRAVHRAADAARPRSRPRERDAQGVGAGAGGHRRVADRPGNADAGPRDGIHGRRAQGLQRADRRRCCMAAVAQKHEMFLCVQDLTCPGASLIHSAGLAAHVPGVAGIEANARQYVPAANAEWESRFPELFRIKDGRLKTGILTRPDSAPCRPARQQTADSNQLTAGSK